MSEIDLSQLPQTTERERRRFADARAGRRKMHKRELLEWNGTLCRSPATIAWNTTNDWAKVDCKKCRRLKYRRAVYDVSRLWLSSV